jgi:TetR/AcrR family transcriptional repressor of bet genes
VKGPRTSGDGTGAPRSARARQRQRLIDASISALHLHGPSKTTVEKVVALAHLSPGIVRFYFDSKDAMLVASLEYLAAEFEEMVLVPVAALRERPVEALDLLVTLYLDSEVASARKVSVWYSFWGEASSRQEYYDICGTRDSKFESLVRELVGTLIERDRLVHLDADAIALGLIGVLEMLWQGFAFQTESTIDRAGARRRAYAYLRSVFPKAFSPAESGDRPCTLAAAAYLTPALLAAELDVLFKGSWQFAGLERELARPGDFLAFDGPADRALVVRGTDGVLRAMRNVCRQRPHVLVPAPAGRLESGVQCGHHGLRYSLAGEPVEGTPGAALEPLALALVDGLVWVRSGDPGPDPLALGLAAGVAAATGPAGHEEIVVVADWKVIVESWLEGARDEFDRFVAPNQRISVTDGALRVLQVVPEAPGRSRLRVHEYPARGMEATARSLEADIALAESVQRGIESPGYRAETAAATPPALEAFRRSVARLLPVGIRSPGDRP